MGIALLITLAAALAPLEGSSSWASWAPSDLATSFAITSAPQRSVHGRRLNEDGTLAPIQKLDAHDPAW